VLEIQLTTATNSVDLLRAEIKREESELAREVSQLGELEKNAKAAKTERKRQTKNDHPVLRRLEHYSEGQGYNNVAEMRDNEVALCDIEADSNLRPFVEQLRSHLESMQSNASQIAGIRDAITRSQAALNLLPLE